MSEIGKIVWTDLTVPNAEVVRDFYAKVVGWDSGEYDGDYTMMPPGTEDAVVGICHAKGVNANLPPQWMVYITVADLDASLADCAALGGKALTDIRHFGASRFCVIQDPAGAVAALYEKHEDA